MSYSTKPRLARATAAGGGSRATNLDHRCESPAAREEVSAGGGGRRAIFSAVGLERAYRTVGGAFARTRARGEGVSERGERDARAKERVGRGAHRSSGLDAIVAVVRSEHALHLGGIHLRHLARDAEPPVLKRDEEKDDRDADA